MQLNCRTVIMIALSIVTAQYFPHGGTPCIKVACS